jgi:hypothetical protein
MEWIQHLDGDRLAALVFFVTMTGFAVIAILMAYDWRRRYRALREYADKVAAQNDELRRIIAEKETSRSGTSSEAFTDDEGPPSDRILH